ncbi:hypothetical protein [Sphingomonas panacisoli]|uniref:hypothetical protein n=1 Tax=Sphingomonas panacisoli TaxID=1813879 RepID=UPI001F0067E7|nr:hypothetical protein [Sphingomonas panacisoli]
MIKPLTTIFAALLLAAPAFAKNKDVVFVTTTTIKDKPGPVAISPSMAYVMLRSNVAVPLYLMKVPSAEDQANYDKMRADALVKAHAKYLKKQKEYDSAVKYNKSLSEGAQRQPLPDKPVEPTEANFEFTPFPLLTGVPLGPLNRFAKADGGLSTYLQELTPGEYRIYGPLSVMPNGAAMGGCYCMGSVAFVAKAGEVVDLGMLVARTNVKRPEGGFIGAVRRRRSHPVTGNGGARRTVVIGENRPGQVPPDRQVAELLRREHRPHAGDAGRHALRARSHRRSDGRGQLTDYCASASWLRVSPRSASSLFSVACSISSRFLSAVSGVLSGCLLGSAMVVLLSWGSPARSAVRRGRGCRCPGSVG